MKFTFDGITKFLTPTVPENLEKYEVFSSLVMSHLNCQKDITYNEGIYVVFSKRIFETGKEEKQATSIKN